MPQVSIILDSNDTSSLLSLAHFLKFQDERQYSLDQCQNTIMHNLVSILASSHAGDPISTMSMHRLICRRLGDAIFPHSSFRINHHGNYTIGRCARLIFTCVPDKKNTQASTACDLGTCLWSQIQVISVPHENYPQHTLQRIWISMESLSTVP